MQQIDQIINLIGLDTFDYVPPIVKLAKVVNLRRPSYLALIYMATSVLLMYLNIAPQLLSDLIGFGYPAYCTYQSIGQFTDNQVRWITYWISYCFILLSNKLLLYIAQNNFLFYLLRSALFIYLFTHGAVKVQKLMEFLHQKYSSIIDKKISDFNDKISF